MARPDYRQRERIRARLKAIGAPCAICGKPINYSEDAQWFIDPKDGKRKRHPLSFEYDHITPYSIGKDADPYGVNSFDNAQAVHRICNQRKGDDTRRKAKNAAMPTDLGGSGGCSNPIPTSRAW